MSRVQRNQAWGASRSITAQGGLTRRQGSAIPKGLLGWVTLQVPSRASCLLNRPSAPSHGHTQTHTCTHAHRGGLPRNSLYLRSSEPWQTPVCPCLNPQSCDSTSDKRYPLPTHIQQRGGLSHPPGPASRLFYGGQRLQGGGRATARVASAVPVSHSRAQAATGPGHGLALCTAAGGQARLDKPTDGFCHR